MNSFPYWYHTLETPEIMFNNLQLQQFNIISDKYDNSILLRVYPDDYLFCDFISNHFTEKVRISCTFSTFKSPLQVWKELDKKNIKKLSKYEQREYIYNLTRECNIFNPSFALWIITNLIGNKAKILDPSSGWGDRLIAALASNAEIYHGYDPNKKLQTCYKKIINMFAKSGEYFIKAIPFELAILPFNFYDIALTSPPYFTLELYGNDKSQSVVKYPNYIDWLNKMYHPYLMNMINAVRSDGFICIYIEDITVQNIRYNIRQYTLDTMNNNNNVTFHSQMGLKVGKNIRWMYVWKKR